MSDVVEIPTSPITVEIAEVGIPGANAVGGAESGTLVSVNEAVGSSTFVHLSAAGAVPAYSPSRPAHGFVKQSTPQGGQVYMYTGGTLNGLTGLTVGSSYFLGSSAGQITATPPTTGFLQRIGIAVAADTIAVEVSDPIYLV